MLSWAVTSPGECCADAQVADLIVNAGLGFGVGVVASVVLFRRALRAKCDVLIEADETGRGWPVALSTG